eukprot:3474014-Amphidinium_carterae.1
MLKFWGVQAPTTLPSHHVQLPAVLGNSFLQFLPVWGIDPVMHFTSLGEFPVMAPKHQQTFPAQIETLRLLGKRIMRVRVSSKRKLEKLACGWTCQSIAARFTVRAL